MKAGKSLLALALGLMAQQLSAQPVLPGMPSTNPAANDSAACEALATMSMPELVTVDATWNPAASPSRSGVALLNRAGPQPAAALPAYCRLSGRVDPDIHIEVWLPGPEQWNGRFLGLGSEAATGPIDLVRLETAIRLGYAVAATDAGQPRLAVAWLNDDSRVRDFGYRAVFEMTAKARAFVSGFYGRQENFAYFNGCAMGGRQALMQAQRFPADYDGIVAGSPVSATVDTLVFQLWLDDQLRSGLRNASLFSPAELSILTDAAVAQCDALDGARDGRIAAPQNCRFDPSRLQCGAVSGPCLTAEQTLAARSIYTGPDVGDIGTSLPGLARGSESGWLDTQGSELLFLAQGLMDRLETSVAGRDQRPILAAFEPEPDLERAREQFGWMLDANSTDLSAFAGRQGKLIVYHGWNDTLTPPQTTLDYFSEIQPQPTVSFARLFMLPATRACPAATPEAPFPGQREIEDWVERAIAPVSIDADAATVGR